MKLFLIDGHALIFKMYYAFLGRPMSNSKGVDTSILYGFTKYLLDLIDREKPSHIAVSFDPPGGTFRNELYPAYKGTRPPTPQLVIDALEPLTGIVRALDIPVLMIPGFEADDIIGSMAKRFAAEGLQVYMVTPDKDYGQLVGEGIFQYRPGKGGENEIYDSAKICEKYGINRPGQVIDMLTICGDASDNVPGVKGVGEKGASKLLQKYGSVENIYEHLEELSPKQRQMFEDARPHIALSKTLVTIKTDIPLEISAEDMIFKGRQSAELMELFNYYEFNSLKRTLAKIVGVAAESQKGDSPKERSGVFGGASSGSPAGSGRKEAGTGSAEAIIGSSEAGNGAVGMQGSVREDVGEPRQIADCSILLDGETLYLATAEGVRKGSPEKFAGILEDASKSKAGYGIKEQLKALAMRGIALKGKLYDCEILHYLINPEAPHKEETLFLNYLGINLQGAQGKAESGSLFGGEEAPDTPDRGGECSALGRLASRLYAELGEPLRKLYDQIEEPLIAVLAGMEMTGVKIELSSLQDFAAGLRRQMYEKEKTVREIAGEPALNVSSPKQIGDVIYEKLRLDPLAKKPKKGNWPTDEETLSALADRSPIIDAILDYRGLRKLLSTYIEPLGGYVDPRDGRVHTTFNQALTSTGRLSSSNPNLQNIPVRTEQGREIRRAFVPALPEEQVMMSADYSQIELRVMAHLSGDEHLLNAFRQGEDVHAATASKIFGVRLEDVTPEQRRVAKTANFGIMYGISAFGLSQRLRTSRKDAKELIDGYFTKFPAIRSFIDKILQDARRDGYTSTVFGRRRYIPEINSPNANIRAFAERNAVNAPIQGTAADIIKIAMTRVERRLRGEGLNARMVLQIHDEILLEVPVAEIDKTRELLLAEMQGAARLNVPLTVECNYGKTWLEAH